MMATRSIGAAERRLALVRGKLDQWEVDALFVSHAANRRWLSGFTGSAGHLLVTRQLAILATDFRYWDIAQAQAPDFELFKLIRRDDDLAKLIARAGTTRIGLEARHTSLSEFRQLNRIENVSWVALEKGLEQLRKVKDDSEVEAIRAAAAIADQAMSLVNRLARPGMSELVMAWELEKTMRDQHSSVRLAFPVTVASGPNSALPHHQSGERCLEAGDMLIVDMGAEVNGYKSDLTRSFYLGENLVDEYWPIYNLVLAAQSAVVGGARPGMNARQLDALGRDLIEEAGFGANFGHGMGHGIGLEIHEDPFLSQHAKSAEETLTAGSVFTVEPGIYLPGRGGVRIEDLLLLGQDGPETLSHSPKTPVIPLR